MQYQSHLTACWLRHQLLPSFQIGVTTRVTLLKMLNALDWIYYRHSKEMSKQQCLISTLKMTLKSFLGFPLVACPPPVRCVTPHQASWGRYADSCSAIISPYKHWTMILIISRSQNKTKKNNSSAPYRMTVRLPSNFCGLCLCAEYSRLVWCMSLPVRCK